ncbi:MbtH family protein [Kitasatospora sp. NBC_01302]|uniref:MbtH family protein n=1 Tax=Kitasatospora sp. NBC_01302 TaxID=2903575 RepID=UPI002E164118|nr:MbtH family NRPS accessory protein [Kitasatospora sp. NBC_01302]
MADTDTDSEDRTVYQIVVNQEEMYSIWPEGKDLPLGWKTAGKSGTKAECLAYIKEVWTDMRPRSLREATEKASAEGEA